MDLCFIDTETTSLNAETGEVWEFAGIRRAEDGTERRLDFQIEVDLGTADPFSLRIGKFRERYGAYGLFEYSAVEYVENLEGEQAIVHNYPQPGQLVTKMDAAKLIEEFTRDTHLVGNVISFDSERLERLLRANWECPGWHYHIIDIEPLIVGYALAKGDPFPLPYRSSDLSKYLGVAEPTDEERHTAMGDAEWVMRQWDALHGAA